MYGNSFSSSTCGGTSLLQGQEQNILPTGSQTLPTLAKHFANCSTDPFHFRLPSRLLISPVLEWLEHFRRMHSSQSLGSLRARCGTHYSLKSIPCRNLAANSARCRARCRLQIVLLHLRERLQGPTGLKACRRGTLVLPCFELAPASAASSFALVASSRWIRKLSVGSTLWLN